MAASPDVAALTALLDSQDSTRVQLAGTAERLVEQAVVAFTDWYDTQRIDNWAKDVAATVQSVLRTLAYLVDAFLAEITGQLTGRWVRPTGPVDVGALRMGLTPAGAYGRVADAYRWQQAQLDRAATAVLADPTPTVPTLVSPIEAALDRAAQVTDLNTQLVVRNQSQASMAAQQAQGLITGWRRVPHPELSKTGTCGLCWAASTRLYHVEHLMPIHHECHCLPMPVTAEHDIGSVINDGDFARLYGDAGGTDAAALKRTRYTVTEHGELGPLLVPGGRRHRTARQARADENSSRRRPNSAERTRHNLQTKRDELAATLPRLGQLVAEDPSWGPWRDTVAERIADLDHQLAQAA